jgi:hypothetical protein
MQNMLRKKNPQTNHIFWGPRTVRPQADKKVTAIALNHKTLFTTRSSYLHDIRLNPVGGTERNCMTQHRKTIFKTSTQETAQTTRYC